MKKTKNKKIRKGKQAPRDLQIIVDLLNFDFSGSSNPPRWLGWFFARYELDYEAAQQLRDEVRELLFLRTPDGERDLTRLRNEAEKHWIRPELLPSDRGLWLVEEPREPVTPREHLYNAIIAARDNLPHLQAACKNCGRAYWRKSDFCCLQCGRDLNTKTSAERMRAYRVRLKSLPPRYRRRKRKEKT